MALEAGFSRKNVLKRLIFLSNDQGFTAKLVPYHKKEIVLYPIVMTVSEYFPKEKLRK